ncbi:MAG: hypothetical protein HYX69_17510 [Planctomycetia bacterium]|nr:hypothetical protein [Planctomycetia bacterium]
MSDAAPKPRRRRFQFSLGTLLLVMTLFAVWLAWELRFIRERQAFMAWVEKTLATEVNHAWLFDPLAKPAQIPTWRRWLGDKPVDVLLLPYVATDADAEKARSSSLPAAHRRESGTGTETKRWSERACAVYARSQSHFPASPF